MTEPKPFARRVRIMDIIICVPMMQAVAKDPPFNGALESQSAHESQGGAEEGGGFERTVRPETVVTHGDALQKDM
jgi:hypothetical protein